MARRPPLISERPGDGLVLRFVNPRLARQLEALPEYGDLIIRMVDGRPQKKFTVARDYLDCEDDERG